MTKWPVQKLARLDITLNKTALLIKAKTLALQWSDRQELLLEFVPFSTRNRKKKFSCRICKKHILSTGL